MDMKMAFIFLRSQIGFIRNIFKIRNGQQKSSGSSMATWLSRATFSSCSIKVQVQPLSLSWSNLNMDDWSDPGEYPPIRRKADPSLVGTPAASSIFSGQIWSSGPTLIRSNHQHFSGLHVETSNSYDNLSSFLSRICQYTTWMAWSPEQHTRSWDCAWIGIRSWSPWCCCRKVHEIGGSQGELASIIPSNKKSGGWVPLDHAVWCQCQW